MEDVVDPEICRAFRWLTAHVLSAAGMTVTVVSAAVATSSIVLGREYGNGVLASVVAVGVGTAAVAGARVLLRKPLRTPWLGLPTVALVAMLTQALVQ